MKFKSLPLIETTKKLITDAEKRIFYHLKSQIAVTIISRIHFCESREYTLLFMDC